jgi:starvation-inducible DNA-binding protein
MTFTSPRLSAADARKVTNLLQDRLASLIDLSMTLKHIHWNVVGPNFIGVHEMLDPQYQAVAAMVDDTAERIASLGGEPLGTPGSVLEHRRWDDYSINRADVQAHLAALDLVYTGVIEDFGKAITATEKPDPVTQDMLIGQTKQLEQFQWFVRAHLEDQSGTLVNEGARTESEAAAQATGTKATATRTRRNGNGNGAAKPASRARAKR